MSVKFYKCSVCGNIITKLKDSGIKVVCCDKTMEELIPGISDGAKEKHVPVFDIKGSEVTVKVGSVPHPMTDDHYIEWIALESTQGLQIKYLSPEFDSAEYTFGLADADHPVAVYAYCNLHGLWMSKII
ncbi:MAG: desulfoferrodoxin family protein [Succinivibrio sp.]